MKGLSQQAVDPDQAAAFCWEYSGRTGTQGGHFIEWSFFCLFFDKVGFRLGGAGAVECFQGERNKCMTRE